ncbi:MAG: hypothetical protein QOI82_3550 [Actinomycetota bacterium]|nr:hypothetical protein [Actinomycetota bacterium]
MTRSTVIKLTVAAALAGTSLLGGSAFAAPPSPITITHNDGGTQVGTGVPGQPLFSVSQDNRGVCFGFSYENGSCIPVTPN